MLTPAGTHARLGDPGRILLKLGTYGFIRVALTILPEAAHEWAIGLP